MPKPRIIILIHYMELGGAEMALLGLLQALEPDRVDIDLFVYSHRGPLMQFIPEWVNLLPEVPEYAVIEKPMTVALRQCKLGVVGARMMAKVQYKLYRRRHPAKGDDGALLQYVGNCVTPVLPRINPSEKYDLCISFLTPHNIGRDNVCARKRLAWIHTDYSTVSVNGSKELPVWNAYDKIASISPEVTRSFLKTFPSLESKIIGIENILPHKYIKTRAEEFNATAEMRGTIQLLSIGRFCTAKNYDNVPDIARRMTECGLKNFKWYIIGYGNDEALIRSKIKDAGMEEHVIILGKKENPYPYIKACDIYVQPSRYEGKSVTVREAQILGKPVIVTNYPTAPGQINHGIDGVIVPLDNEGCAQGLADFIRNTNLQNRIKEHLKTHDFAGNDEIRKIYDLLK